jgi:uncharacterized protein YhaN
MRLFNVELETEPRLAITLHPRLTVIAADPSTRVRIVDALDRLMRGRAGGLKGSLAGEGANAEFMVESSSGPILAGAPMIVHATDVEVGGATEERPSPQERAEARHAQALEELDEAEKIHAEAEAGIEALRHQRVHALEAIDRVKRNGNAPDDCRRQLRVYVDELDAALRGSTLPDAVRIDLLERGTMLVADAARLGVCRPMTVRTLLDAVDALNRRPARAAADGSVGIASVVPRDAIEEIEGPFAVPDAASAERDLVRIEAELRDAVNGLGPLERAVSSARSRALAVFAELEALRRTAGPEHSSGFAAALRARLSRRAPTSWVGPPPVILDDALVHCPDDERDGALAVLIDIADRAQVIYITDDADALAWAARLAPTDGVVAQPTAR